MVHLTLAILLYWILLSSAEDEAQLERSIGPNSALRESQVEMEAQLKEICLRLGVPTGTVDGRIVVATASTDASALASVRKPLYPISDPIHQSVEEIGKVLLSDIPRPN